MYILHIRLMEMEGYEVCCIAIHNAYLQLGIALSFSTELAESDESVRAMQEYTEYNIK